LTRFFAGLAFLRNPALALPTPPSGIASEPLPALIAAWKAVAGASDEPPSLILARRLTGYIHPDYQGHALDSIVKTLGAIDAGIIAALDAGAVDPAIVRTADFQDVIPTSTDALAAGCIDSLPQGHPLRSALAEEEYFRVNGRPALLLGRMIRPTAGRPVARPWYWTGPALARTRERRKQQQYEESERQRLDADRYERQRRQDAVEAARLRRMIQLESCS
jgi:hypothetical protein